MTTHYIPADWRPVLGQPDQARAWYVRNEDTREVWWIRDDKDCRSFLSKHSMKLTKEMKRGKTTYRWTIDYI